MASKRFDPTDAEAQFLALRGEILGEPSSSSSSKGGESSFWGTVAMLGAGITAAAATAAGVHYLLNQSSSDTASTSAVKSSGKKKKKKKKKKSKAPKKAQKKAQKKTAAAAAAAARGVVAVHSAAPPRVSAMSIPGLTAAGAAPRTQGEFEQLVAILTHMYAAQQGTAMCLMALGRTQDAIKLGFTTAAKRAQLNLSGIVAEDAPVPPAVAARLARPRKSSSQNKCEAVRRLLAFNMGDFALQSFAKLCSSTLVQTDAAAPDDGKKLHAIDLLVTAAEFAAIGAKEGMQAFHMVQQCLAKASQTIRVKGNAAQQKYITDMQRGHSVSRGSGNTPTGVPELLAILQHVLLQKRAQMERGNLTRSSVREVFQSQTINVAKFYYILSENVWGKDSVPANEAMLKMADILCATDMFKLTVRDTKLCQAAHAGCMKGAIWENKSHAFKAQLGITAALVQAFEGDYDRALSTAQDAVTALAACGDNAFVASDGKEAEDGGTEERAMFKLKHVALLATLLLVDGRLDDACSLLKDVLDKVPFDSGESNGDNQTACIDGMVYKSWSELARYRCVLTAARNSLPAPLTAQKTPAVAPAAAADPEDAAGNTSSVLPRSLDTVKIISALGVALEQFPAADDGGTATLWCPPSHRTMTRAASKMELTMFPAVARTLGFQRPSTTRVRKPESECKNGESPFYSSKGTPTLFITSYLAQAANVLMQQNRMSAAMVAYKLMVRVSDVADRRANPQGHAVLCEGLVSLVQVGVTHLTGSFLEDGLAAGGRLLEEFAWQRAQDAKMQRKQELEAAEEGPKDNAKKARKPAVAGKWKPNVHRITHDQVGRMEVVNDNAAGALQTFKSAIDLTVYEATEAQNKIDLDETQLAKKEQELRDTLGPMAMEKVAKLARDKATESGASPEEIEKKVNEATDAQKKRTEGQLARMEKQSAQKKAIRAKKSVPAALVAVQTLKGAVHMLALSTSLSSSARQCRDIIAYGTKQYAAAMPTQVDGSVEGEEDVEKEIVEGNGSESLVQVDLEVDAAQAASAEGKTNTAEKPLAPGQAELKQLAFAALYVEYLMDPSSPNEAWDALGYARRKEELKTDHPALKIIRVAVEIGSRYTATRQMTTAFKYLRVAWHLALHLLDPTKQTQVWVFILKELVKAICATSADDLMASGYEPGTIPRICDLLSANKITTEQTLSTLRLKHAAIEALSRTAGTAEA
jgi:hypothetical protein